MPGVGGFGYFEFALVGLPLLAGTVAIVVLFGERLFPQRSARIDAADFSDHARTLAGQYGLEHPADALFTRKYGVAEVVIPRARARWARPCSPGWSPTAATCRTCSAAKGRGRRARGGRSSPRATRCSYGDAGARSTTTSTTPPCSWSTRQARSASGGAARARRNADTRRPGGDGRVLATGALPPAVAGLRGERDRPSARDDRRAGLSGDLLDDRDPRRRDDPALDGDDRNGSRGEAGRRPRARRRRRRFARAATWRSSCSPSPRSADQQHGNGADRDPHRHLGCGRPGRVREARADGGRSRRGRPFPDPGRDACEPDGDGTRGPTGSATTGSSACRSSYSLLSLRSFLSPCSGRSEPMGGRVAGMRSALAASAFLLFALSLVPGCGGDEGSTARRRAARSWRSLAGVPWKLVSGLDVEGVEHRRPARRSSNGAAALDRRATTTGGGPVTIDGDSMKIGMVAATQIPLPTPRGFRRARIPRRSRPGGRLAHGRLGTAS